jgi:molybdopterin synthase sulfur carrier subunit
VTRVRVALPHHLRGLAGVSGEVAVEVAGDPSIDAVLDGLEAGHPALLGTIRDRATGRRRPHMRYMACGRDLSHEPTDAPLPAPVAAGQEPLRLVGAISGG